MLAEPDDVIRVYQNAISNSFYHYSILFLPRPMIYIVSDLGNARRIRHGFYLMEMKQALNPIR